MTIFIDESGIFANPNNNSNIISAVGSLIIPERFQVSFFKRVRKLFSRWGFRSIEVKGSRLDEAQVASFINLLSRFDVLLKVSTVDMGLHSDHQVKDHKLKQADKVVANITKEFHPNMVKQLFEIRDRIKKLSNPLYVQAQCLVNLCSETLETATIYYSLRFPHTLGRFVWVLDSKGEKKTEYESLWELIVLPMLQSRSLHEPFISVVEGDYSHFKPFENPKNIPHEHLKPFLRKREKDFESINLNKIFQGNMHFRDSKSSLGLQAVDILVTSIRRACQGTLQKKGWRGIGKLIPRDVRSRDAIRLLGLGTVSVSGRLPYSDVFTYINRTAKEVLR